MMIKIDTQDVENLARGCAHEVSCYLRGKEIEEEQARKIADKVAEAIKREIYSGLGMIGYMPFIDIIDEHGKKTGTAHMNMGGRNVNLCRFCWKEDQLRVIAGKLCDFVVSSPQQVTHKRTCDAPICAKHATSGGKDIDYCPDHKHAAPQGRLLWESRMPSNKRRMICTKP